MAKEDPAILELAGTQIKRGERKTLQIPVAGLYTGTELSIPVQVIRARKPGPTVFVSAAIHGDELNGIEIVRRLINSKSLNLKCGTLILVPMVNVYGVQDQSRYLPDRRDLNRCFPGSAKGSLAGRLANTFMETVVANSDYGIDLHTGAIHRSNLPQVRANLKDKATRELAVSFGVPVILNSNLRDGSLRQSAVEQGVIILLYEAGQALRFDEVSIRAGVRGVKNVLATLGMRKASSKARRAEPFVANNSAWVRAGDSGIVVDRKHLGDAVKPGDVLASIGSPLGETLELVKAPRAGIVIGKQNIPLVQEGDAMFHIAYFAEDEGVVADQIESMPEALGMV